MPDMILDSIVPKQDGGFFDFHNPSIFWSIVSALIGLLPILFWWIDRRERKRLHGFFREGRSFRSKKIAYSLTFFPGARVDRITKKASVYAQREMEKDFIDKVNADVNVILLGNPLGGKTRLMVECLKQLKKTDCIVAIPAVYAGEINFPRKRWFTKKHILVIDDLQDFFKAPNNARLLLDKAFAKGYTVVANCRSSGEWRSICNAYDTLSIRFDVFEMQIPTQGEITAVVELNGLNGIPSFYDKKNIGSLIIDLDTMRHRYEQIRSQKEETVLICIKELYVLGIVNKYGLIRQKCIRALATNAHGLLIEETEVQQAIQWAINNDFVKREDLGIVPETVYFDQIVHPGYAYTEMIESGIRAGLAREINCSGLIYSTPNAEQAWEVFEYLKRRNIPQDLSVYNALLASQSTYTDGAKVYERLLADGIEPNEQTFYTLINFHLAGDQEDFEGKIPVFEKAIQVFELSGTEKPNDSDVFFYWGLVLDVMASAKGNDLNLFTEASIKYERATSIKNDYHQAFYNWGIVLAAMARAKGNDLDLFKEACTKYERATLIKKDFRLAFYNLGCTLDAMARAQGNDLDLFKAACTKYERVTLLKNDDHEAFYNWGYTLAAMARAKGNDLDLFKAACTKYERATRIKEDKYEAFYNWGLVLEEIAAIQQNDEQLLQEAHTKIMIAHQLRPDLIDEDGYRIQ